MNKMYLVPLFISMLLLTACASAPNAPATGTFVPSLKSPQTSSVVPVAPFESAFAAGDSTAAPTEQTAASHEVTFETPDGATITGELYGSGKTAVIFSMMGNCSPGWSELAQLSAAQGLMALTYSWRDCGPAGPISEEQLVRNFLNDTRGAINYVRDQGAENLILAGASLGGIASAKLAAESRASGLVILAAPLKIPNHDVVIEASDLNVDIPKLFMTSDRDSVVPADETRKMYELAAEPREWQTCPGAAHGTDLFRTENGRKAQERILAFILAIANTP